MTPIRAGAVGYLNAKPLVYGLDRHPRFSVRFDVPARCAALLHEGAIDLGLIPSIEYLQGADYLIAPDGAVVSHGAVVSVALFTSRPIATVRTIGLDSSSRTSVALLRILCARRFGIAPKLVTVPPDLPAMVDRCDAALLIGDPALFADEQALGLEKVDLGHEWTAMTGLPFVYAFWAGRPGVLGAEEIGALKAARDAGSRRLEEIAREAFPGDPARIAKAADYLARNVQYDLGDAEREGLRLFFQAAIDLGLAPPNGQLRYY